MKILFLVLLFLLSSISVFANMVQMPKERVMPEEFVIGMWDNWLLSGYANEEDFYKEMFELGINTGLVKPGNIKLANEYKFRPIIHCITNPDKNITDLNKQAEVWAKQLKKDIGEENLDGVFQIFGGDEPSLANLERTKIYADAIRKYIGKDPFFNMNPEYLPESYLMGKTYEEYLDLFMKECSLSCLSYDNYSWFVHKGFDEDRFYGNIELIKACADKYNVPFRNIILSCGHFNYADPTEYSVNVQAWSSLAYGVKGITYFNVFSTLKGDYRNACFDDYGNRTDTYNYVKNMNYALHTIVPTYLKLKHINVCHDGNVPKRCKSIDTLKLIEKIKYSTWDNKPNLLIGEFVDENNKPYCIIVNKSSDKSLLIENIKFKNSSKVTKINHYVVGPRFSDFVGENTWIGPGHGVFLKGD